MTYQYENCDPEGFQMLCQALFLNEFPGLHCFPVGQPDGGRDAVAVAEVKTILQVKFKRRDEEANAKWMIDALEKEKPKIERLIRRGAEKYVIVTNASGSPHLDVGEQDLVEMWLSSNIEIPAEAYWRTDLDIRMNTAPKSLWFNYPHILTGTQGIALAISESITSDSERRMSVLRTFAADQFRRDKYVKFKQVDLSNEIADLFVDVPVNISGIHHDLREEFDDGLAELYQLAAQRNGKSRNIASKYGMRYMPRLELGAAEMIMSSAVQRNVKRVLLQGGPGQGKSTLAQYVCQIHRAHFLEDKVFLDHVPDVLKSSPFRLPFKVDLRDLALYIAEASEEVTASFEIFLASMVQNRSGGRSFDVDDLYSSAHELPVLIFLDGLDEVADPVLRQRLVEHVQDGLERLQNEGCDIQVVLTSRPAVFGKMPSLQKAKFLTLRLAPIGPAEVTEYTDKWIVARRLDDEDEAIIRRILDEKIQLDHIRDLTRNPMQLAILLSLIHSVGYSLPDERTDLYQKYVDIFLTREADKDATVREHRKLLIETVEYVAWVLHHRAETNHVSGRIAREDLRNLVSEYLNLKQESNEILDRFFTRGLERVYVIVERTEGFYEFEVQPLREFFCARFLYDRAPVGTFRQRPLDDRSERLLAMAQNPYWMNVLRFYAGCYSTGELGSLMLSLKQLICDKNFIISFQARRLAAALLGDWVFRSSKFIQNELITLVFDKVGVYLAAAGLLNLETDVYSLHRDCGSESLKECIAACYLGDMDSEYLRVLDEFFKANGGKDYEDEFIALLEGSTGAVRTFRLARMLYAGAADSISAERLWGLVTVDDPSSAELKTRCKVILQVFPRLAEDNQLIRETLVRAALAGQIGDDIRYPQSSLGLLMQVCSGRINFMEPPGIGAGIEADGSSDEPTPRDGDLGLLDAFASECRTFMARPYRETHLHGWMPGFVDMVEALRARFGESWAAYSLAVIAAGTPIGSWKGCQGKGLFDSSVPIVERARFVRLKKNPAPWMIKQLKADMNNIERRFWLALTFLWLQPKDIKMMADAIEEELMNLDDEDFECFSTLFAQAANYRSYMSIKRRKYESVSSERSPRFLVLWGQSVGRWLWEPKFSKEQRSDSIVQRFLTERNCELNKATRRPASASDAAVLRAVSEVPIFHPDEQQLHILSARPFVPKVANWIIKNITEVHPYVVENAISSLSSLQPAIPIASVARQNNWKVV